MKLFQIMLLKLHLKHQILLKQFQLNNQQLNGILISLKQILFGQKTSLEKDLLLLMLILVLIGIIQLLKINIEEIIMVMLIIIIIGGMELELELVEIVVVII